MKKEIKKCQTCKFCNKSKSCMTCKSSLSPNYGQTMYLNETCEVWSGINTHKKEKDFVKPIPKDLWKKVEDELKKK